ncbi:hypothetical protein [Mycolicibacterium confluentis]|uniref:hypothetical protein n=1 Tax=Mycolicibacterium confluentis TaxID=28047 RepID=UPI0021F31D3B|nr:hypothetical protein [Mycolicibacterium confluentis]MCV7320467.1 hypothetical protein [Mycolicibacterium confluentis]
MGDGVLGQFGRQVQGGADLGAGAGQAGDDAVAGVWIVSLGLSGAVFDQAGDGGHAAADEHRLEAVARLDLGEQPVRRIIIEHMFEYALTRRQITHVKPATVDQVATVDNPGSGRRK